MTRRWGGNQILLVLLALVAIYFLAAMILSLLRLVEFQTGNWDLGIFQQAFWSTGHGHPLYEAGDYETSGAGSLFQIHPALLLVPLAALYAGAPAPLTLFTIQCAAVALAAIPLFFIARDVTHSDRRALLVSGIYLIWPPLLAANLYDFHLESFLPLELFTLFLFWSRKRYAWGAIAAGFAWVTIQAGPVFVAVTALYFLLPAVLPFLRNVFHLETSPPGESDRSNPSTSVLRRFLRSLVSRDNLLSIGLGLGSVASYLLFLVLQNHPAEIFLPVVPVSGNPLVPFSGGGLYVSLGHLSPDFLQKVGYWSLLYALVGFLPLRALRTQLLALPWIGYTFVSHSEFTVLGNQYGFVVTFPLMIGLAYGFGRSSQERFPAEEPAPSIHSWELAGRAPLAPARRRREGIDGRTPRLTTLLLVGAVVLCGLLSPANPLVQAKLPGEGYDVSYIVGSSYSEVRQLLSLVPANATVLSSNDLFTFFANDLHAYALLWTTTIPPFLPFNQSVLPSYLAIASIQWTSVPSWLAVLANDPFVYQILGSVVTSSAGTVTLFGR